MQTKKVKKLSELNFFDFDAIKLGIASPEQILSWSYGEVKKPETINYRTLKPERDGLFCERIFGPTKDYECACGKYRWVKFKGIQCDRCGVEITEAKVRRERMGHIELAVPVAHVWFLRKNPSRIGIILDMRTSDLERVVYYAAYVVIEDCIDSVTGRTDFKKGTLLSDVQVREARKKHGARLKVDIGAPAIQKLLQGIDFDKEIPALHEQLKNTQSELERTKLIRRIKTMEEFKESGNRPEWMIMSVLPVIPPDLRPLVPLDGGRFAASDLNDLYRRIINRNNRLKHIESLRAPEVMIYNEKRLLQEAVDALIENGARGKVSIGPGGRPLKSLSDSIKGKHGRFRQNLLGKRVDYSGRSVIVVGPNLKLHQCGLPKLMALELFKPFIIGELMKKEGVTLKSAKKMLERVRPEIWDILEKVTKNHPVLLNRAPTLHRLGIQAFEPVLIEGKAIQLHPLTCAAFNADFDGDQMAVHIPLSVEAQIECRVLMMSTNNILSPANGGPVIVPSQDIVLGLYYMTSERSFEKGEGMTFCGPWEVEAAYDADAVSLHARINVRMPDGKTHRTTPGRVLVSNILPKEMSFENVNLVLTKKMIAKLVENCYRQCGIKATVILCDNLKNMGYEFATRAGVSIGVKDLIIPARKKDILAASQAEVDDIERQYRDGIITRTEKYNKVVDVWTKATQDVSTEMIKEISYDILKDPKTGREEKNQSFNSIFMMSTSGARGNQDQMRQLAGMRGLMAKPSGEIIETPITSSFREGLSVLQYFTSTHGARKGLADTALKTANSGYLTRRLVDVVQDVIVSEHDCGTVDGIELTHLREGGDIKTPVWERAMGRVLLYPVYDPEDAEKVLLPENTLIDEAEAAVLREHGVSSITVRSPLTCQAGRGICALCYGRDLARGHLVNTGETVGIIAAQSIGEPGTQLTMRTFHIGGTASSTIEKNKFEAQNTGRVILNRVRAVTNRDGIQLVLGKSGQLTIVDPQGREREKYILPNGARLHVTDGQKVTKGTVLAEWDPFNEPFVSEEEGIIRFTDIVDGKTVQEKVDDVTRQASLTIMEYRTTNYRPSISVCDENGNVKQRPHSVASAVYSLPVGSIIMVKDGEAIQAGDIIARKPRETSKTKDIVGGLPRVAELFEVRKPKDMAVVSEISGTVSYAGESKGKRKLVVTPEIGDSKEYLVPKGKHITVADGDFVEAGDPLTEGSPELHDILRTRGEKYLARYLVDEIQEVYRFQGVGIDDKHIEVIVRQMLKKVTVLDSGGTSFLVGEQVDKAEFKAENHKAIAEGRQPATAEPLVLGITQASLTTSSFISAASFQETTKVLTEASLKGKMDYLRGLKENVIVGRLIPAGTGYREYVHGDITVPDQKERPDKFLEDLEENPVLVDLGQ